MYERVDVLRKADEFSINRLAAARMRVRYLLQQTELWIAEGSDLALYWTQQAFDEIDELTRRLRYKPKQYDSITPEQIQQAREYPIDKLIEFNRHGKAYAWCHHDSNPSLTHNKRHNRAHCFPCSCSFNPIDVLIQRDGMSFANAVQELL